MPYTNEHAARLQDPDKLKRKKGFDHVSRTSGSGKGTVQGVDIPNSIDVIWYIYNDETVIAQALRFPIKNWTEKEARKWLKDNDISYILFEPASEAEDINEPSKAVYLLSDVDDWSVQYIMDEIEMAEENRINLYISSYGGSVNSGFQLANYIMGVNRGGKKINTYNLSHADSIATVVFLAPPKSQRHIVPSSTMFKHEPRFMMEFDITKDKANKMSEQLEIQKQRIAQYYTQQITGLTKEEALQLMANEVTLTAEDMVRLEIVEDIQEEFLIAAYAKINNKSTFNNMGLFDKNKSKAVKSIELANSENLLLIEGDLEKGAKVLAITNDTSAKLPGTHNLKDGRKIVVNSDDEIEEVQEKEPETEEAPENLDELAEELGKTVKEEIQESENRMKKFVTDAITEALKGITSNHKPQKSRKPDNANQPTDVDEAQAATAANISAKLKEKVAKYQESKSGQIV